MKSQGKKPEIGLGALIGLLLSAPLLAVSYAGMQLAELPFIPFIVFDQVTRMLPGPLITFLIDRMVRVIRSLNLSGTAVVAKAAEQLLAVAGFLIAGMITVSLYFSIMHFIKRKFYFVAGILMGGLAGLTVLILYESIHREINLSVNGSWIMSVFLIWGASCGWVYLRLTPDTDTVKIPLTEDQLSIERIDRRRFIIKLGSAVAVITVFGTALAKTAGSRNKKEISNNEEWWSSHHALPNADAMVKPAQGTRSELTPVKEHYRIDINTAPPEIREASWRLKVNGLVEQPLQLTLENIRSYEPLHQFITLSCISNPVGGDLIGTTRWTGVSLKHLLPRFQLKPDATHLKIRAADGFYESISLADIRADERVMLTYAWDGVPLTAKHGFPLRIYLPNVYGMKQPKWIESMEATDHWEEGYWVTRGWDKKAEMKATSVIDTIAIDMMIGQSDEKTMIPIGGIAHAGVRGISKVEVQVDDGKWEQAKLRTPLSGQTWVIWRYDWPFQKGRHNFTVRCFDGNGILQITEEAPPHPSGASGLYSRKTRL
jgi:DMSO/TMAO reductase YedYZ molybdopterin-dependent catalytic subunit